MKIVSVAQFRGRNLHILLLSICTSLLTLQSCAPSLRFTSSVQTARVSATQNIHSQQDQPSMSVGELAEGYASYYGDEFHGRVTSSGEIFDQTLLTAAHRTLPFGTIVRVVNLRNNRAVIVKVNDRGPFVEGRSIDLSRAAAEKIDMLREGVAHVSLTVLN